MPSSTQPFIPCSTYVKPPAEHAEHAPIPPSNFIDREGGPQALAMELASLWANGKVLRVLLLDTWVVREEGKADVTVNSVITAAQRTAVTTYVKLWEQECNIRFQFVTERPADIRVGFGTDGHWSCVGKACAEVPPDERTMNLEFTADTTEDTLRGTTLHEFGHALGCIHEHQSPASPILWDEAKVLEDAAMWNPPWDEAMVRHNILNTNTTPAKALLYKNTVFDRRSIMLYAFDASWTTNHQGTNANEDLSRLDKSLISEMYPRDTSRSHRFETPRIADNAERRLTYPTTVALSTFQRHSPAPKIAVGLTTLSVAVDSNVRVRAKADTPERKNMIIHLDSWANTKLQAAGCTWLEAPDNSFFQTGTYNTMETRSWRTPAVAAEKTITFGKAFAAAPTIVVWLNWMDIDGRHDTSVKAYTTAPTATGFTIHIDAADGCQLYSAGATWIAYPAGSEGVKSGVLQTTRGTGDTRYEKASTITFPEDEFEGPPNALIAVTALHFSHGSEIDFGVMVDGVESTKMECHIKASNESMCRSLDATWIAY